MTRNYIPADDPGKLAWLKNFDAWLQAHGAAHGIDAETLAEMAARTAGFGASLQAQRLAHAAARAATQEKNGMRASALTLGRACAQHLQSALSMTDEERAAAGLTVPDRKPTPTEPGSMFLLKPPLLELDFSIRRQVIIHWGPNPGDEHRNGKPEGVRGCQIQAARGGIPVEAAGWVELGLGTRSPHIHHVDASAPVTFAYRARYVGHNLEYGNFGEIAVCTVSV